jgi:hypothetical protein
MSERLVTPVFRVAFPKLSTKNDKGKHEITMLFKSDEDLKKLEKMAREVYEEKFGKVPSNFKGPFRDGNDKDVDKYPFFADTMVGTASTKYEVGIVDRNREPILDANEIYAGCYARATVTAWGWEYLKKKGVAFNLCNIQKVEDAERLAGSGFSTAEDDFDVVEEVDSDFTI